MSDHVERPDLKLRLGQSARIMGLAVVEFRQFVARPNFGLSLAGGIALTALSGPFGTYHDLTLGYRTLYWGLAIGLPALLLTFLSFLARALVAPARPSIPGLALGVGVVGSVPGWALLVVLESVFPFPNPMSPLALLPLVVIPSLVTSVLINLLYDATTGARRARALENGPHPAGGARSMAPPGAGALSLAGFRPGPDPVAADPQSEGDPTRGLSKLPHHLGTEIITLQAQGHYLNVTTARGRALILLRMGDAEAELADLPGLRVHRSWWVNLRHARRLEVRNGRVWLELSTGVSVPVARGLRRQVEGELLRMKPPG